MPAEVLLALADYCRSGRAGRSADAQRDCLIACKDLLKLAGCRNAEDERLAVSALEKLDGQCLVLERDRKGLGGILRVRLPLTMMEDFFTAIGRESPAQEREKLASLFERSLSLMTGEYENGWRGFCARLSAAARKGDSVAPFDRKKPELAEEILAALPLMMRWPSESLIRFASAQIFHDSKKMENTRGILEKCLVEISGGKIDSLSRLGILERERSLLLHGPIRLVFEQERELNVSVLRQPARIGWTDLRRARVTVSGAKFLTVENASMLHELAKWQSGVILASSGSEGGFANAAVIELLKSLPDGVELWHFGDADPKGFEILADLRSRSGRQIRSLHMNYRPGESAQNSPLTVSETKTAEKLLASDFLTPAEKNELQKILAANSKGLFEQESLGLPGKNWPFY